MSSVLNILQVLGMKDSRTLEFPDPKEKYDSSKGVVVFTGIDGNKKVSCAISFEALDDHFGNGKNPLKNFVKNRTIIENEAKKKYFNDKIESDGSILIRTEDLDWH